MAKQLTYADALRMLGTNDSEVLDLAEKVTDGGLGLVGVPDVFGVRGMLVSKGRKALEGMRGKLKGESRLSRTDKIEAAHRILVITSFFEALQEVWDESDMPIELSALEITTDEQWALLDRFLETDSAALPSLFPGNSDRIAHFSGHYRPHELADTFFTFVTGLRVAEEVGLTSADRIDTQLGSGLIGRAIERYRGSYRRLAAEIPEFGMWVHLDEHERTRDAVGAGFGELRRQLEAVSSGRSADRRRLELSASHRAVLRQPVLRSDEAPPGLALPTLEAAYIPPSGRVAQLRPGATPSTDGWWDRVPVVEDLQSTLAAHLVHRSATEFPMVVLGHPGAGKSKFTEMLAARLPAADFLPIRVELRSIQPDSPIHLQIEEGLAATLHTRVSWRELAESADGALPVIILDGFDELLQATGVNHSDYLECVQEFQHQQEALGQPVAVVVTSRTVVANRVRFPTGTTVIRLEPFDSDRIGRMLRVWNRTNAEAFASSGLEPLTTDVLMKYQELAEQPLLLLMLLIYDAEGNDLRHASEALSHGELYERLLTMFARREVNKDRSGLDQRDFDDAVEEELRSLEIAALAMFTRRGQSVAADDLDADLAVLMPEAAEHTRNTGPRVPIAPAHQLLGRFFFVHEARAQVADGTASVFEFLHATFGEYLVARAVAAALKELVELRSRQSKRRGRGRAAHPDDGELYALSSFASYAGREKVMVFLAERVLEPLADDEGLREEYVDLLVELFREAPFPAPNRSFTDYEPVRLPLTRREANYTSNLILLLALVRGEPIDIRELFPDPTDPLVEWQHTTALWRTLPGSEWFSVLDALRVRHVGAWDRGELATLVTLEDAAPTNVGECLGFELRANTDAPPVLVDPYEISVPHDSVSSRLLRSMALRVNGTAARVTLGLLPFMRYVSPDLGTWFKGDPVADPQPWSAVHEILFLRLRPTAERPDERLASYHRLLPSSGALGRVELLALTQAAADLTRTPHDSSFSERLQERVMKYCIGVESAPDDLRPEASEVIRVVEALSPYIPETSWLSRLRNLVDDGRISDVTGHAETGESIPAARLQERLMNQHGSGG